MSIRKLPIRPRSACTALSLVLAFTLSLAGTGCQKDPELSQEPATPDTYFPVGIGESTLQLQLALTPAEQQKGLMFREELPQDHGLLFLFNQSRQQGFWMKNTSLPLDIGYFDASGTLLEIHKLFPYDETSVISRSPQVLMAIETNRGWYAENGIKPGMQVDMGDLKAAVTERGFPTDAYPLDD